MVIKRALLSVLTLLASTPVIAQQAPAVAVAPPAITPVIAREQGQLVLQNVPVTPIEVRERLIQYNNTRAASFQDFTPDGGILISTRFGDTPQIHAVAMPMGA